MGIYTYDYAIDSETLSFERENHAKEDREYASAYAGAAYDDYSSAYSGADSYDEY